MTVHLWSHRIDGVVWTCELIDHGPRGVEAQILRHAEHAISRRFPDREQAVAWADQERRQIAES